MKTVLEIITEIKKARALSRKFLESGDDERFNKFLGKAMGLKAVIYDELQEAKKYGKIKTQKHGNLKMGKDGLYSAESRLLEACIQMIKKENNNK